MKKFLGTILLLSFIIVGCVGCGAKHVCDDCEKTFTGTAYYDGFDRNTTMCPECATKHFAPFPIRNWAK